MTAYVVDADVGVKWHIEQPDSEAAERVLASEAALHAPEFQHIEVSHVLAKYARLGLIGADDARDAALAHRGFVNHWHGSAGLIKPAMDLALEGAHPFYDCLYLALAIRLDAQLVTADKGFAKRFADGAHAGRIVPLADF